MTVQSCTIDIVSDIDVMYAAMTARRVSAEMGFSVTHQYLNATATSELSRNILVYAKQGRIEILPLLNAEKNGIKIIAEDSGPGIPDITKAMTEHYSTGGTMGVGLPGVKRAMDEFELISELNKGTRITIIKWLQEVKDDG
ncbi:anti-sigma regulatory factor [Catenovulum sediminis]|uniref:Anti-sigma regulatory factor n=1 Tax=Catenovulum sediminis TaxID=1740262 RepID=A0ABV1RC22_9ALTE|nr:anti-sigma regulatory factor [Catenovulum sediminis]